MLAGLKWSTILLNQSFHFGFFLQKINLLKDSEADKSLGRCYFSSRESLRASLVINARYAMDYLKRIPIIEGRPYRLFCAWSLFIGLASLKWLDKNWQLQQNFKIKPRETYYIINQVRQLIDDNHALEKLFNSYLPEHNKIIPIESEQSMPSWFHAIYPDDGEYINWLELGMIDIS